MITCTSCKVKQSLYSFHLERLRKLLLGQYELLLTAVKHKNHLDHLYLARVDVDIK